MPRLNFQLRERVGLALIRSSENAEHTPDGPGLVLAMSDICAPQPVHSEADHHVPELPRICEAERPRGGDGHLPVYDDDHSPSHAAFGDGLQAERDRDRQTADWLAEGDAIFAEVHERLALGAGGFVGGIAVKASPEIVREACGTISRLITMYYAQPGNREISQRAFKALSGLANILVSASENGVGSSVMTQATRFSTQLSAWRNSLSRDAFDALTNQIAIIRTHASKMLGDAAKK